MQYVSGMFQFLAYFAKVWSRMPLDQFSIRNKQKMNM